MAANGAWAVHGGRIEAARRAFPEAPEPWIDLSTGISPYAYPLPDIAPEDWTRLPEPEALAAVEQLAGQVFAQGRAATVAAPGSEPLLRLLPLLRARSRVVICGPTYGSHVDAWSGHDVVVTGSPVRSAAGVAVTRAPPAPRADVAVTRATPASGADLAVTGSTAGADADVVVLVNPNNPDGRVVAPDQLSALAAKLDASDSWLVVDEAFADFGNTGIAAAVAQWPRGLIVLRSFGKAYGLAGVRLGFALVHPALEGALRARLGDWPVSGPALRIAARAYADAQWRATTLDRLALAVRRLDALITRAGGLVTGGTLLFRFSAWPDAAGVFDRLARAGVLVRPFADAPDRLRFGLPSSEADWARLAAALLGEQP